MTKYGAPKGVEPASNSLAMAGWSMQGQRLALGLEARDHFARIHPGLYQLERDAAA
jgi:hypothetical protein